MVYSSYGLSLTAHEPFTSAEDAVATERDIVSNRVAVRYTPRRAPCGRHRQWKSTKRKNSGAETAFEAYRKGIIKEKNKET